MTTHLLIAGHGLRKDGSFDPGATGLISKGEHEYMKENLFPAMKNYVPEGADIVFFDDYNVYSYGNIVELAKKYGADTKVTEFHYDAGDSAASGGHVIVYAGYEPDDLDLRLRDAIEDNVGVRYEHKGHKGISGRNDLANVNRTASGKINYRLVEVAFGTNEKDVDVLLNHTDEYAKSLVEALLNTNVAAKPKEEYDPEPTPAPVIKSKTIDEMAQEVIDGKHGNGHETRQKSLGISDSEYEKVRARVNELSGFSNPTPVKTKSIDEMAQEIIAGEHGNGHETRQNSLGISDSEYEKVKDRVNELAGVKTTTTSSTTIKVGDKVTARYLYSTGNDSTADRSTPITGYVEKISNSWKNPYRLVKTKGKTDYLGFARKEHLSK